MGGNERQTTERRCLNPPTAIRPGLNTAHPHISKGQGRYKGGLVLQKAWHEAPSPVFKGGGTVGGDGGLEDLGDRLEEEET